VVGTLFSDDVLKKCIKKDDIVIHLANVTDACNPEIYYVNVEGTRNLVNICKAKKIKKFIYLGSANACKKNKDKYDKSKFLAELLVKNAGMHYIVIRPGVIYGKYDVKNISCTINALNKTKIKVFLNGKKDIQPVYAGDVVEIIANNLESKKDKILNVLTPPINKKEFIKTITRAFNFKTLNIFIPSWLSFTILSLLRKNKSETIGFSMKDLEQELGKAPTSFYNGLKILKSNQENENLIIERTN
jgi:NADH dehydrogenase